MIQTNKKTKPKKKTAKETLSGEVLKFDAQERSVGRLAAEISFRLQDKHRPDYAPNKAGTTIIEVENADKIKLTGQKWTDKKYYRHSGYLGSLKEIPAGRVYEQQPSEVLRLAVWGMLPKNRLRKERIKRLKFV